MMNGAPRTRKLGIRVGTVLVAGICFSAFGLSGCAVLAIGYSATAAEKVSGVRLVEDPSEVRDCKHIQDVYAETNWGGLLKSRAWEKVVGEVTQQTAAADGNVILVKSKANTAYSVPASFIAGSAYRCGSVAAEGPGGAD